MRNTLPVLFVLACGPVVHDPDPWEATYASGFRIEGAVPFAFAGAVGSSFGDLDGDGVADLWVSQAGGRNEYVVWGGADRPSLRLDDSLGSGGLHIKGVSFCESAGDVDGDGHVDLHCNIEREPYLLFGLGARESTIVADDALVTGRMLPLLGTPLEVFDTTETSFHLVVTWVGDVDGDGRVDAGIRSTHLNSRMEAVGSRAHELVFSTSTGPSLDAPRASLDHVRSVKGIGDWNRDGIDDLLVWLDCPERPAVGEDATCVYVRVIYGGADLRSAPLESLPGFAIHPTAELGIGGLQGPAGDVTGDGVPDILVRLRDLSEKVGQPRMYPVRNMAVIAGGAWEDDFTLAEVLSGERGFAIENVKVDAQGLIVGDLDGDGRCELLFALNEGYDLRGPRLIWGRDVGHPVDVAEPELGQRGLMLPPADEGRLELPRSMNDDFTGDGLPDIVLMYPRSDTNGEDSGVAIVVSGAAIGALRD